MKKILAFVLIILVVLGIGGAFFAKSQVKTQIQNLTKNFSVFEVKKEELDQSFTESKGYIEGTLKGTDVKKFFQDNFESFFTGVLSKDLIAQMKQDIDKAQATDINLRYDYTVKHSPFGIASGYTSEGKVTFLDKDIADGLKTIFNTDAPLTISINQGIMGGHADFKLADMVVENTNKFEGIILSSDYTSDNKINDIGFKVANMDIVDNKVKFNSKDLYYNFKFDKSMDTQKLNFIDLLFVEGKVSSGIKNVTIYDPSLSITISDIVTSGYQKLNGDDFSSDSVVDIKNISVNGYGVKNLNFTADTVMSKEAIKMLYSNVDVNFEQFFENEQNVEKFFSNFKFNIKNLSVETPNNEKVSLLLNMKTTGYDKAEKIPFFVLDGEINTSGTLLDLANGFNNPQLVQMAGFYDMMVKSQTMPNGKGYKAKIFMDSKNNQVKINDQDLGAGIKDMF